MKQVNPKSRKVRKSLPSEVYDAVRELTDAGWTLHEAGHKYRLRCPCYPDGRGFPVPGSPSNAGNTARRVRRNAEHCPDQHDLMK